jgi:hypothetical protein
MSPLEQRMRFATPTEDGRFEILILCRDFGISQKTGCKWLGKYWDYGSEKVGVIPLAKSMILL